MEAEILSILNMLVVLVVLVLTFRSIYRVESPASQSVDEMLDSLMTNHTVIISISKIDETSLCVSVVADWTGYAEQCFFNETIDAALAMAVEHKAKCENGKVGA